MSERQTAIEFLSQLPLFRGSCEEDLAAFAATLKKRTYRRGEVIIHQDDPAGNLFLLVTGYVSMALTAADGRVVTLAWIRPAGVFGTMSSLDELPQALTVTAGTSCEAFIVEGKTFRDYLLGHPEAALAHLRGVALRWRAAVEQLQDMAFLDINGRLAKVLLNLATPKERSVPDRAAAIADHFSQSQLAALIGASRESVNKALQTFVHQEAVAIHDGRVEVLDETKLRSYFQSG